MSQIPLTPTEHELKQAFRAIKGEQIPSMPEILNSLYTELGKREPDTNRIAELVASDQGITGQVLKSVNSPVIGLRQPVESIHRAVIVLGLEQVKNLVTAAVFQNKIQLKSKAALSIWEDSLSMAKLAARIAQQVHGITPDEAYLAALLHNCGALLLAEKYSLYVELLELENEIPNSIIAREKRQLGTCHTVIGYLFAQHWKLPERICQAIYLHHQLQCKDIEDPALRALIAILKLAYLLSREDLISDDDFLSVERVQFFHYAKKELMFDDSHIDEFRSERLFEDDKLPSTAL
jgi:HD-like signal output (HDOD) protein